MKKLIIFILFVFITVGAFGQIGGGGSGGSVPVGTLSYKGNWSAATTYKLNDVVTDVSGNYFRSLANSNTNNATTQPSVFWQPLGSGSAGAFAPNSNGNNLQNITGTKNFCVFGDSRSTGTGASPSTLGWNFLLANDKAWTMQNKAVAGYDSTDLFQTIVSTAFSQTNSGSACTTNFYWAGVNANMQQYHTAAAWLADLVWMATPDASSSGMPIRVAGNAATQVGTGWTTTDHFVTGIKTTVSGDTATGTVVAANAIYPIVSYALNTNFTWCFQIDTQPQVCYGPMGGNGTILTGVPYEYYQNSHNLGLTYQPYAVRQPINNYITTTVGNGDSVPTIPRIAQPHSWTFTCQNANGSACYLEGVVGDGVDHSLAGMETWVLGDFRGNSAQTGLITESIENRLVATLAADGFNVGFIPLSDALDCTVTTAQCADGLHPSNAGHALIERKVLAEISSLITPRDRQAMKSINTAQTPVVVNSVVASYAGAAFGAVAQITPDQDMVLRYVNIRNPNLTCSVMPTVTVQQSSNTYTLSFTSGNTQTLSGNLSQLFRQPGRSGALGPVVISLNAGTGCTGSAANVVITAGFTQY